MATIGIRLEDKNRWERRVPLTPADAAELQRVSGHDILVQSSPIRVFTDDEYRKAGLTVTDDATTADVLIGVKEIPKELFRPGGVYLCFSHVIKAQDYNMPMLGRLLDVGATLLDYERIVDASGRRLIFFSEHAGVAGMIESLRALGLRLAERGVVSPLAEIRQPHEYDDVAEAEAHLREIGGRLPRGGVPLVVGIAGYGNVSRGAQTVLDWLPVAEVSVADLPSASRKDADAPLVKVVFKEQDMVEPDGDHVFELQNYYDHPERYRGRFADHLPHLDLLVNTIFWTERYPRLVTRDWARAAFAEGAEPRLQVIGDISIDIEGSIELSLDCTTPDEPSFVYDPDTDAVAPGVSGRGVVVMAVDNLPCELPREASQHFSSVLKTMIAPLGDADWTAEYADLDLPDHLKSAVIAHKGVLAPAYAYLAESVAMAGEE